MASRAFRRWTVLKTTRSVEHGDSDKRGLGRSVHVVELREESTGFEWVRDACVLPFLTRGHRPHSASWERDDLAIGYDEQAGQSEHHSFPPYPPPPPLLHLLASLSNPLVHPSHSPKPGQTLDSDTSAAFPPSQLHGPHVVPATRFQDRHVIPPIAPHRPSLLTGTCTPPLSLHAHLLTILILHPVRVSSSARGYCPLLQVMSDPTIPWHSPARSTPS
ncbi:uncharacterized protein LAESUDRAFT_764511 [Laetiporus sulphureus 93-53]|uniref:Uncharacterized protein n=1 Tax=Laetiporus sulphureus 93-53 TaxID=1314785 RepID=A0A165B905_9APHY|nr:uncharacterized protein LAESUDRAFT_764511 [Laetiporus sulphureus 93-53]KZT00521.1 hypothetical protein LAESUDRAFT_764511 [Laetiporus sulphureus 93-53]